MPTNVITGPPGSTWKNDTGKVAYQFKVARANTCGLCYSFEGTIRLTSWPIPLHRGCKCEQALVYPDESARPFVDFRRVIRDLDESQRNAVVGATNYRLIEAGVVRWEDVVTASRIRDLTEVVALKRLTVRQMVDAGVPRHRAEQAVKAATDARNSLAEESRRRILAALERRGIDATAARRMAAGRLAERVTARPIATEGGGAAPVVAPVAPVAPPPARIETLPAPPPPVPVRAEVLVKDRPKYEAAWNDTLGRVPADEEVTALAGAPEGAEVRVRGSDTGNVTVTWTLPGVGTATRVFYRDDSGRPTIQAAYFEVEPSQRGKGLGRELFGRMVDAAVKAGFDRVITRAVRGADHNGYAVWPLFGYDAPIPEVLRKDLPEPLAGSKNLSDLMRTEEGRAWWTTNGGDVSLTFSLRPRSKSLRIWRAYQAAKAATSPTSRRRTGR